MNKEEILAKSRNENKTGDEMEKTIEKSANENAYLAIMAVFALLIVAATMQKLFTGSSFADYRAFFLAFLVGYVGKNITKFIYSKNKSYLYVGIVCIIGSLACLASLIMHSMELF